jgi:hypothetical protein
MDLYIHSPICAHDVLLKYTENFTFIFHGSVVWEKKNTKQQQKLRETDLDTMPNLIETRCFQIDCCARTE